ncbi:MAG: hypothetical protein R3B90_14600 [Planctomycetaceae bacterium]
MTNSSNSAPAATALSVLDRLIDSLREQRRHHKLFDALMLKRKSELGLPLFKPASLQDVPREQRPAVEETYVASAREVGQRFLDDGDIPSVDVLQGDQRSGAGAGGDRRTAHRHRRGEDSEQILRIALYEGVHPARGLQMMLRQHGTCSTITSLDQSFPNLSQEQRQECAG